MSLVLYHGGISTCSQKVRLVLAEKGLTFRGETIDVPAGEHLSEWYLALNPNGVIPTLVHDGAAIIDSSVICEYLEETFWDPPLAPGDALGRARMRAWMRYFEEVPTAAIRIPSFNLALLAPFRKLDSREFAERAERMPLRRHFYQDMGQTGFSEKVYEESLQRLAACVRRVDEALADGRAYLLGDLCSLADFVMLPSVIRMQDLGLATLWEGRAAFTDWLTRMENRPSFAQAYYPGCRLELAHWQAQA
jgi:glutathione S-transferase